MVAWPMRDFLGHSISLDRFLSHLVSHIVCLLFRTLLARSPHIYHSPLIYYLHPPSCFPRFVYHRTLTGIVSNIIDFTQIFDTNRLNGCAGGLAGISLESSSGHKSSAPTFYSPQEYVNRSCLQQLSSSFWKTVVVVLAFRVSNPATGELVDHREPQDFENHQAGR